MATIHPRNRGPPEQPAIIDRYRQLTKQEAWQRTGGLSRTTKMPCHSWGLPAHTCKTGSALATIDGTVCAGCYARNHAYTWPNVQQAYERRYQRIEHPNWEEAMAALIDWQARKNQQPYFRWFDSGDLQVPSMLERIANVARNTPHVQHWLPTKEHAFVRDYLARSELPQNLTLRLSAHYLDSTPPAIHGLPTSTVHRDEPAIGHPCPAYDNEPSGCGECRACWEPSVENVSYPYH